ncbi:alpha/beta hydrolase [Clostridium sp. AM54-14XD]|uniref:alpha/beta fold hydrolase n=1 Tax=Clostridium sp. AM54-14XD TaxID=2293037 RepID=UPI001FAA395E|nr:alpha/beta hydrolase [Clostridium sp. AM54-14XD]
MKYLYLHGLGQKPDSWNKVIKETKVSESSVKLSLAEMLEGKSATYKELYSAFSSECDKVNDEIVLCGLSLGAVLALNYAMDHPDKVKALVLIAAQYKMPKNLLKVQNILFHLMRIRHSVKWVSKKRMLSACAGRWLNWISVTHCIRCLAQYCSFVERRTLQTKKLQKNFAII